jgi:hypothetical protein
MLKYYAIITPSDFFVHLDFEMKTGTLCNSFDWTQPVDLACGRFDGTNSLKTARKVIECFPPPDTDAVPACLA